MSPTVAIQLHAHTRALRGLARDLVRADEVDDLLQDVAVQALTAPPRDEGPLGGWFATVVRGLASKRRRADRRRQRRERAAARAEALPAADVEIAVRDAFERLGAAVLALPQPYQGVLLRRYVQEQSPRAIALATGVPVATVKSRLQRGLALLRQQLARGQSHDTRFGLGLVVGWPAAEPSAAVGAFFMASTSKLVLAGAAAVLVASVFLFLDGAAPVATPSSPPASTAPAATPPAVAAAPLPGERVEESSSGAVAGRVAVPVTATWVVEGRAVRRADVPAPGARVRARMWRATTAKGPPDVETHLIAGADGRFAWPLDPPEVVSTCEVVGEGERVHSNPERAVVAPGEPPPTFEVVVTSLDAVVRGRVLDDRGQPVPAARVSRGFAQRGVRTDAEGRFELAVVRGRTVSLTVDARGFVQLRQEVLVEGAPGGEIEMRLRRADHIHGRVTDPDGRPLEGAVVRTFHTIFADAAETDADGRFVVDNLDPSLRTHGLFARKEGFVEAKVDVETTAPDVEQDLVLARGVGVQGTVFGPGGLPVPAATVFLGFSPSAYDRQDAVTDAAGRFAFGCVGPGEHTLNVERRGLAGARMQITVPAAPASAVEVRVDLEAGHFIGGVVRDAHGSPLPGVTIAPRLLDEYLDDIRGTTDGEGRFRLEGLPAIGLSLELYGRGLLRTQVPVAAVDRDDLVVVLQRHGVMAGRVLDGRTGEPVRDFRIRFGTPRLLAGEQQSGGYSAQWVRGGKAFHTEDGTFRIDEEVEIGSVFALEASAAGFAAAVVDRVVARAEADPDECVFRLFPGSVVEGTVRDRESALPIAGARLTAWVRGRPPQPYEPNDDEGRPIATSDAAGVFRLENVPAGDVFVRVEHPDWLPATHGPLAIERGVAVPPQQVVLGRGVTVTVAVRKADGSPLAGAEVQVGNGEGGLRAVSDATGKATIERVPPGTHELVLVEAFGEQRTWTFRRLLEVGHEGCAVEFVGSDGDASAAVTIDAPPEMPADVQILFLPARAVPGSAFRARGARARAGRNVVTDLPAMELRVLLFGNGWQGAATVTTQAGKTVEVGLVASRMPAPGGR